ncbi:MAG TPA: hypothetical protein VNT99_18195 [Methylomirabilota bacterium]|nr:hypothetical protein [Methylomirabilota bacterium]
MAEEAIRFNWQWPAGRKPDYKLLIDVSKIRKESSGLFGLKKSESIGDQLPEATEVVGRVISGREQLVGKEVIFRAPRGELKEVVAGQRAAVAIIERDNRDTNICVCIVGVPKNLRDAELQAWLRDLKCE